ncbi:hypothetical protein COLO4_35340 [Corchorus olitorius]|uniref:Uncharacterized protein n=1 Tax=Corchorus olitorius TaxID=93759 RepID=A0A1R3GHD2_9ROSI|nr:hypothetical protein COLO4_35340 [Corchorus olitorius]
MSEIVLCPLLQVVFEKLASRFLKEIATRCGFKDEINKLERSLRTIQTVIRDAEERQATDKSLKLWLSELKDVAYDADDLLEEFSPLAMVQENDGSLTEQVSNIVPSLRPFMTYLKWLPEFKQIRERLDVLLEERSNFNLKKLDGDCNKTQSGKKRETGSFVIESEVIGREEDTEKIVEINLAKLRYVSVVCDSESCTLPEALYEAKKLRTLILLLTKGDLGDVPTKLYSSFRHLRVLDLGNCGIKRVQSTISCLKYLRYLNLSNSFMEILPENICSLHNLQVLNLSGCSDLIDLPRSLPRLYKLRHLIIDGCERLTCLPRDVWKLKHLQTLPLFIVADDTNNLRENANLLELKRQLLKGKLTIRRLENVKREYFAEANLKDKHLHSLNLSWGDDHEGLNLNLKNNFLCKMGEYVLESLQPPQSLKRLSIKGYPGVCFPRWMRSFKIPNLTKVELINCKRCERLPALGQLLFLEIIHLHGMDAVRNIGSEFYGEDTRRSFVSLKELSLIDFPNLEFWWSMSGGKEFPSLVKLTINRCPKLVSMPQFSCLRHLELQNCHEMILRSAVNVTSLSGLIIKGFAGQLILLDNLLQNNVNLVSLTISSCPNLRCIPPSLGNLVSLESLAIRWCEDLVSLPQQLQDLTCLQSLEISECHSLSILPEDLSLLRSLAISDCPHMTSLPEGLQRLSNLQRFSIHECPRLEEHCKKDTGKDWPKIAHIAHIHIGSPQLRTENVASSSLR